MAEKMLRNRYIHSRLELILLSTSIPKNIVNMPYAIK